MFNTDEELFTKHCFRPNFKMVEYDEACTGGSGS